MNERSNEKHCANDEQGDTNLKQTARLCELTKGCREVVWMRSEACWNTQCAATE